MNLLHGYIMLFVLSALDKETQGSHSQSFYNFSACWMYKEIYYEASPQSIKGLVLASYGYHIM